VAKSETEERIRTYFKAKTSQMKALAELAVCEHSGLIGSHREELHRIYLQEILPKRFSVGRGMIYGFAHRSREVDIVLWDHLNYMSLPLLDHSFFFAESVRLALECKSSWNSEEMSDVLEKSRAVRDIVPMYEPSMQDTILKLALDLEALQTGASHSGMITTPHHIGTASIFLRGGQSFGPDYLTDDVLQAADDSWPDALILLQPGKVVLKTYESDGGYSGRGSLEFYEFGDDALLVFTNALLTLLEQRSVITESPFYLPRYVPALSSMAPVDSVPFAITRPVPQRMPLWQ
jgi:hypothetical protein